jgi:hypothetical protein
VDYPELTEQAISLLEAADQSALQAGDDYWYR